MTRRRWIAALLCATAAAGALDAQQWRGERGVQGRVTDVADRPVPGAEVALGVPGHADSGPPAAITDAEGRWAIGGLAPGRFAITIKARGFIHTNGTVDVPAEGPPPAVDVLLLPLSWEPPALYSDNPLSRQLWIEKGNSLLEQGDAPAARAVYETLLSNLPQAARPEVLQAIARTHFLEGRVDRAVGALEEALTIDPGNAVARQLYTALLEGQGRGEEAAARIAELTARGPSEPEPPATAEPEEELPAEVLALLASPAEPPAPGRTGAYKTAFTERSPWSTLEDYAFRMGTSPQAIRAQDPDAGEYALPEETFQVLVPESYAPGEGWGVVAWISPVAFGGSRHPGTLEALAARKLIWVGANHAGNERPIWDRIWLALDALHNLRALYDLDPGRSYVGGYSGGGRAASRMGVLYPDAVDGAWSLYGCDYYRAIPLLERPGARWPAKYPRPAARELRRVQEETRFVVVTGPRDFNFTQTRATRDAMRADGFEHVTYLEIPGADHYTFPDRAWLERIFAALDGEEEGR